MSVKSRMIFALVLAGAALACAAFAAPDYFAAANAARAAHTNPPTASAGMMVASLLGLGSWLAVVTVQWRNRQFGWVVASVVFSYLGIIAYSILNLTRSGSSAVPAEA
jgi:hypothetical protein